METALNLIQTLGFPMACCIALALSIKYLFDIFIRKIDDLEKTHKEETDHLSEAVNNNTSVIRELLSKLSED